VTLTLQLATFAPSSAVRLKSRSAQPSTVGYPDLTNKDTWFLFAEPQEDRSCRKFIQVYTTPTVLVQTKIGFVLGRTPKTCRFLPQFIE
jgi:hypothetical protein